METYPYNFPDSYIFSDICLLLTEEYIAGSAFGYNGMV